MLDGIVTCLAAFACKRAGPFPGKKLTLFIVYFKTKIVTQQGGFQFG
jgi:hypothetical protein